MRLSPRIINLLSGILIGCLLVIFSSCEKNLQFEQYEFTHHFVFENTLLVLNNPIYPCSDTRFLINCNSQSLDFVNADCPEANVNDVSIQGDSVFIPTQFRIGQFYTFLGNYSYYRDDSTLTLVGDNGPTVQFFYYKKL